AARRPRRPGLGLLPGRPGPRRPPRRHRRHRRLPRLRRRPLGHRPHHRRHRRRPAGGMSPVPPFGATRRTAPGGGAAAPPPRLPPRTPARRPLDGPARRLHLAEDTVKTTSAPSSPAWGRPTGCRPPPSPTRPDSPPPAPPGFPARPRPPPEPTATPGRPGAAHPRPARPAPRPGPHRPPPATRTRPTPHGPPPHRVGPRPTRGPHTPPPPRTGEQAMADALHGKRVAILAADGVERVELQEPRKAVEDAGARTELISLRTGRIQAMDADITPSGTFEVDREVAYADVDDYDALIVPGGTANPDRLRAAPAAVEFVRGFVDAGKPVAAICHGPWILVEA